MAIRSPDFYINLVSTTIIMTDKECIMRERTKDILGNFLVNTHYIQDVDQTFEHAIKAVQMIIDLPVCWIDKELQERQPEWYDVEGTLEYWEEMLNELKIMK